MKKKRRSGVYKITNTFNNKCYIGSAIDLTKRKKEHFSGSHTNKILKQAMKKYGKESFRFDILMLCKPEDLLFVEQDQIDYWKKIKGWENLYNIASIAGSTLGMKLSEDTKQKMSEIRTGEKNPMYGRTGEKNPMYGMTGEKNPMYGMTGEKNPMYGRSGKKHPNYDHTIYNFVHKDGRTFTGTAYELRVKEGLYQGHLSRVIHNKQHHTGGWSVAPKPTA
jgi:group I intron endonuclease